MRVPRLSPGVGALVLVPWFDVVVHGMTRTRELPDALALPLRSRSRAPEGVLSALSQPPARALVHQELIAGEYWSRPASWTSAWTPGAPETPEEVLGEARMTPLRRYAPAERHHLSAPVFNMVRAGRGALTCSGAAAHCVTATAHGSQSWDSWVRQLGPC